MSYQENRVLVKVFGSLPSNSPLLINIPTTKGRPQQRLHKLAAQAFLKMSEAVKKDLGIDLLCSSGWRPHRWTSRQQYEQFVTQKYGSVAEGRKWLAYDSPHETGLACDFGCGGVQPTKATIPQQVKTPLFNWLVQHAWEYGWTPYKKEPWHWEYCVNLADYKSGVASGGQITLGQTCVDDVCVESED